MKQIYLLFAILGTIVPYIFFGNFMIEHGVDLLEFIKHLFANSAAGGFTADLLISSAVFWVWSARETRRIGMRNWWVYVVLNLTIGLSCALPLFLFFRHRRNSPSAANAANSGVLGSGTATAVTNRMTSFGS